MANRYWNPGTVSNRSGDWNSTSSWSTVSSGSTGASVPTSADDVIIDPVTSVGFTITINAAASCKSINITGASTPSITISGTSSLTVSGISGGGTHTYNAPFAVFIAGVTFSLTGGITFAGSGSVQNTYTSGTTTFNCPVTINGSGIQLNSYGIYSGSLNATTLTLTQGSLILNGNDISVTRFASSNSSTRSISFGTNNSITVNGTGTVWDTGTVTNLTITGTPVVTVSNPTVTAATVISGALSEANSINFYFINGAYTLTFLATAGHTARTVNFNGFTGTLAATQACTVYGDYIVSTSMTVTASSNTLTFGATSGSYSLNSNGKTLPPIIINGSGGTYTLGSAITTNGSLQVLAGTFNSANFTITSTQFSSNTTNTRNIDLGSSTINLSGTAPILVNSTNLTFSASSTTTNISSTTGASLSITGGITLGTVNFTATGAHTNNITISGSNTFNTITFTNPTNSSPNYPTIIITGNQTINTLSNTASANIWNRYIIKSSTRGTQVTITITTPSLTDVDFLDINVVKTGGLSGTRLGNIDNNTNINFITKTVYWNLSAGGNWNSVAWATTLGGTPDAANFPLVQDTAVISSNLAHLAVSTTITINGNYIIGNFDASARANILTLAFGSSLVTFYGDFKIGSNMTVTGTGTATYLGRSTGQTIYSAAQTSGGYSINTTIDAGSYTVRINPYSQVCRLATVFTLTSGNLIIDQGFQVDQFVSNNSNARSITVNYITGKQPNISIVGTTAGVTALDMANVTNYTTSTTSNGTADTSKNPLTFYAAASVTRTFTFGTTGGTALNAPWIGITSGASAITFTTGSWFSTLELTNYTGTIPTTTLNLGGIMVGPSGVYTNLTINLVGQGYINNSSNSTLPTLTINNYPYTTKLSGSALFVTPIILVSGTLSLNGYYLQTSSTFTSTGTSTRELNGTGGPNSFLLLTGAGTVFSNASATGLAIKNCKIMLSSASAKTFAGGGVIAPTMVLDQNGSGALTVTGNNTFRDWTASTQPSTITTTAGSTQTFTNFTLSGISGSLVTLNSSTAGTKYTLVVPPGGPINVNYLSIQDCNASRYPAVTGTSAMLMYAGANSTNVSNNTGWVFTTGPTNSSNMIHMFL